MALESRKKQVRKGTALPKEFIKSVSELFNQQFEKERKDAEFLVYGTLFLDEAVVCVSLTHAKSLRAASFYLSTDLPKNVADNPSKVTERLKSMVDLGASWFAQVFEKGAGLELVLEAINELEPDWDSVRWENEMVFVRANRDNHALENAADRFLSAAGVTEEELDEAPEPKKSGKSDVDEARERLQKLLADLNEDDDDSSQGPLH